jgi:hypothetical protein
MKENLLLFVLSFVTAISFGQNWNEIIKATASDRDVYDIFGYSVSISGDYAIVGAPNEDEDASGGNTIKDAGSAYIFKNIAGTWTEAQKIVASDRASYDIFGYSVSISEDYAIVGALDTDGEASGGNAVEGAGSAYIFKNNSGTWSEVQKIVASDRASYDDFGHSVSISGDYAIVGAPDEDEDASGGNTVYDAGSAYVFENSGLLSVFENNDRKQFNGYPNPTNGNFSVDMGSVSEHIQVSITDISGRLVESKTLSQSQVIDFSFDQPAGVYLIFIQSNDQKAVIRMVKE